MVAYSCAMIFWGNNNIAILCGLTMTATAVSLTMVSLKSEGLHLSEAATGIMTKIMPILIVQPHYQKSLIITQQLGKQIRILIILL